MVKKIPHDLEGRTVVECNTCGKTASVWNSIADSKGTRTKLADRLTVRRWEIVKAGNRTLGLICDQCLGLPPQPEYDEVEDEIQDTVEDIPLEG